MSKSSSKNIITCKAAVCWGAGEAVRVEEIQVEPPKSSEVRVKMLCASLCHTDLLCCKGFPLPLFPRVLGHEGVGIVESIGEGVKELREGDLVIPSFVAECKECDNCKSGKTNICLTHPLSAFTGLLPDGTSRMSITNNNTNGVRQELYHFLSCSTWSEYTVVDSNYLVKIDSRITLPHASFISCGFSTGFGAAWKEAKVQLGDTVAVLGLGAVGLGVVEGSRMHGASKIIGIDVNDFKRAKGEAFGMTDFVNPTHSNKSISAMVKDLTGGMGVDYCFECSGVATLVNEVLESTKVGVGTTIILGAGTQKSLEIDFIPLLAARPLKYSVFGGLKIQSDLPVIVGKCINKEIEKIDELLTYEVQLEAINRAFELLKKPDCVKILIKI